MIDYTTILRSIEQVIKNEFTTIPVKYENVGIKNDVKEFISLKDNTDFASNLGFGESITHLRGVLSISIFTEIGKGTKRSRDIATELDTILSSRNINGVMLEESYLRTIGETEDMMFFEQILHIPYSVVYGQDEISCD